MTLLRKRPAHGGALIGCGGRISTLHNEIRSIAQPPVRCATPGPILSKHFYRGCELLAVTP